MTALTETHSLGELAAAANREHVRCEAACRSAIEHAFRAGQYLIAAKSEVSHGEWMAWVDENFLGSYRTAAAYMQVARDPKLQRSATFESLGEALKAIAAPRGDDAPEARGDSEAEVIDAEPDEPKTSIFDLLREEGGLNEAEEELRKEDARRDRVRFPRPGMERKTMGDVRKALARAEHLFEYAKSENLSDWSRGEALIAAGQQLREAGKLVTELGHVFHEWFNDRSRSPQTR